MDYLFRNEIETLIKLSRAAAKVLDNQLLKEEDYKLVKDIETVCVRIENYFKPETRNPSDMKLSNDDE